MSDYFTPPPKPGCRIRFELSHRNLQFEIAPVSVWLDQDDLELCEAHVFLADAIMHAAENDGRVTWGIYIASIGHPLRHVMDQEDPKKIINDLDFHFGEEVVGAYIRAIYYFHNHDMFKPACRRKISFSPPLKDRPPATQSYWRALLKARGGLCTECVLAKRSEEARETMRRSTARLPLENCVVLSRFSLSKTTVLDALSRGIPMSGLQSLATSG